MRLFPGEKSLLRGRLDANSCAISSAIESCGAIPRNYPLVGDDLQYLKEAIARGWEENDLLLVSGGSSVGVADYTLEAMLSLPDGAAVSWYSHETWQAYPGGKGRLETYHWFTRPSGICIDGLSYYLCTPFKVVIYRPV